MNRLGLISIVIPTLNEERLLPECLQSLKEQDYEGKFELVIADNGSHDNTVAIARRFGARIINCPERKGVFYARQAGADAAPGEIIIQADADTTYPRGWLKRIASHFIGHPEVVAVAGRFIYRDPPGWARLEYWLRSAANVASNLFLRRPLVISGATFAFRRLPFTYGNGYHDLTYAADQYGIASRLSRYGRIIYDARLCVQTSARSVRKPFHYILLDFIKHMNRWGSWTARQARLSLYISMTRSARRRMMTRLAPVFSIFILFAVYGYFIPQSPVFGKVYYEGRPTEGEIALTFDDGPNDPYTSQILDILAKYDVKATFFVVGRNVELYPDTARRIVAEGHVVGNHSYSHLANHALSGYGYKDLVMAQEAISGVIGLRPHLYRPPHGKKSPWELMDLKHEGLIEVTWSVSTPDQHVPSPEALAAKIITKTSAGDIILLHDGYGTSHNTSQADKSTLVQALPLIIAPLQTKGFSFVTVPKLLNMAAYQ